MLYMPINEFVQKVNTSMGLDTVDANNVLINFFSTLEAKKYLSLKYASFSVMCLNNPTDTWLMFETVHRRNWIKALETLDMEYNPIENYDRIEESSSFNETNTDMQKRNEYNDSKNGTSSLGAQTQSNTDTLQNAPSDTDNFYNKELSTTESEIGSRLDTNLEENEGSSLTTDSGLVRNESRNNSRIHGNVGVTQTQTMIENEISLRKTRLVFEYYDTFIRDFCFLIDMED